MKNLNKWIGMENEVIYQSSIVQYFQESCSEKFLIENSVQNAVAFGNLFPMLKLANVTMSISIDTHC